MEAGRIILRPDQSDRRIEQVSNLDSLLRKFEGLRLWTTNGHPAPLKPLVVLLALGRLSRGKESLSFVDVNSQLTELVRKFLPGRSAPKAEQPFWRLKNDNIWKVNSDGQIRETTSGDAFRGDLKKHNAHGEFTDDILKILESDPQNIDVLAAQLLDANFPPCRHQEILDAVGLPTSWIMVNTRRRKRFAKFRRIVLEAYEYRCCVCGYDVHIGGKFVGLEAAHIRALCANGPDVVPNGFSLCAIHHNAFDRGAFTIQDDRRTISCSQQLEGLSRLEWLTDFHGQKIRDPRSSQDRPAEKNLAWHRRHTFREPARTSR